GTAVPPLARQRERLPERAACIERAVDQAAVAAHDARASKSRQPDLPASSRLEEHLRPGRHCQTHAPRLRAVEMQDAVDLEEVEVRRHADEHLALVDDLERRASEPLRL